MYYPHAIRVQDFWDFVIDGYSNRRPTDHCDYSISGCDCAPTRGSGFACSPRTSSPPRE